MVDTRQYARVSYFQTFFYFVTLFNGIKCIKYTMLLLMHKRLHIFFCLFLQFIDDEAVHEEDGDDEEDGDSDADDDDDDDDSLIAQLIDDDNDDDDDEEQQRCVHRALDAEEARIEIMDIKAWMDQQRLEKEREHNEKREEVMRAFDSLTLGEKGFVYLYLFQMRGFMHGDGVTAQEATEALAGGSVFFLGSVPYAFAYSTKTKLFDALKRARTYANDSVRKKLRSLQTTACNMLILNTDYIWEYANKTELGHEMVSLIHSFIFHDTGTMSMETYSEQCESQESHPFIIRENAVTTANDMEEDSPPPLPNRLMAYFNESFDADMQALVALDTDRGDNAVAAAKSWVTATSVTLQTQVAQMSDEQTLNFALNSNPMWPETVRQAYETLGDVSLARAAAYKALRNGQLCALSKVSNKKKTCSENPPPFMTDQFCAILRVRPDDDRLHIFQQLENDYKNNGADAISNDLIQLTHALEMQAADAASYRFYVLTAYGTDNAKNLGNALQSAPFKEANDALAMQRPKRRKNGFHGVFHVTQCYVAGTLVEQSLVCYFDLGRSSAPYSHILNDVALLLQSCDVDAQFATVIPLVNDIKAQKPLLKELYLSSHDFGSFGDSRDNIRRKLQVDKDDVCTADKLATLQRQFRGKPLNYMLKESEDIFHSQKTVPNDVKNAVVSTYNMGATGCLSTFKSLRNMDEEQRTAKPVFMTTNEGRLRIAAAELLFQRCSVHIGNDALALDMNYENCQPVLLNCLNAQTPIIPYLRHQGINQYLFCTRLCKTSCDPESVNVI